MEEAKKKLREIFAGYDYDIPEEVKLNLIKEWQKDLDKIKELEAKILSLECDNNELQEEANYYRNESLRIEAEYSQYRNNIIHFGSCNHTFVSSDSGWKKCSKCGLLLPLGSKT